MNWRNAAFKNKTSNLVGNNIIFNAVSILEINIWFRATEMWQNANFLYAFMAGLVVIMSLPETKGFEVKQVY